MKQHCPLGVSLQIQTIIGHALSEQNPKYNRKSVYYTSAGPFLASFLMAELPFTLQKQSCLEKKFSSKFESLENRKTEKSRNRKSNEIPKIFEIEIRKSKGKKPRKSKLEIEKNFFYYIQCQKFFQ
jgi:hypothetical protein